MLGSSSSTWLFKDAFLIIFFDFLFDGKELYRLCFFYFYDEALRERDLEDNFLGFLPCYFWFPRELSTDLDLLCLTMTFFSVWSSKGIWDKSTSLKLKSGLDWIIAGCYRETV